MQTLVLSLTDNAHQTDLVMNAALHLLASCLAVRQIDGWLNA